jgi:hypothetical protein
VEIDPSESKIKPVIMFSVAPEPESAQPESITTPESLEPVQPTPPIQSLTIEEEFLQPREGGINPADEVQPTGDTPNLTQIESDLTPSISDFHFSQPDESPETIQSPLFEQELHLEALKEPDPCSEDVKQWICPYLKLENDPELCYADPNPLNTCHNTTDRQLVSLAHQEEICLSGKSAECPLISGKMIGSLPPELSVIRPPKSRIREFILRDKVIFAIVLLLAVGGYILFAALNMQSANARARLTPVNNPSILTPAAKPNVVSTISSINETAQVTPSSGQQGQDVILGPQSQYLVHVVLQGESLDSLTKTYNTSPEVINKVNSFLSTPSALKPLVVLVMVPGQSNVNGLIPLHAVQVEKIIPLSDFLINNQVTLPVFDTYNQFKGDQLQPGQWVILPTNP